MTLDAAAAAVATAPTPLDTSLLQPLLLSTLAGFGAASGGLFVFALSDAPSQRTISFALSFAAGVMICVSIFDLWLPQCLAGAPVFATGFALAGAAGTRLLTTMLKIPDPEALAGTAFGSWGMLRKGEGALPAASGHDARDRRQAWRVGALLALVLTLHNLPEGLAVGLSQVKSPELGLVLCVSIFIHNISEGIVVAVPVLAGTGSKWFALALTAASGLSEPLGALLGVLMFRTRMLSAVLGPAIEAALSAVAGVMVSVSLTELLPQAMRHGGSRRVVYGGLAAGAALIGATMLILH